MPGSRKFSPYFHENLSRNLLSLLDFYVNYKESIVLTDILSKCFSESYKQRKVCWLGRRVPFNLRCSTSVAWCKYYTVSKLIKISLYAQAWQLPLLQAQSSVWNRLVFLNNFLMLLHKLNEIFRANWTWISDCRASSILKTVPVSQDSKEYAWCKRGEFVHNNTKPLFRIAWHFWTNTKYSGEVSLIISMDIFIGSWLSVRELYLIVKHIKISLYAQTQQSLLLLTQGNIYIHLRFLNNYLVF